MNEEEKVRYYEGNPEGFSVYSWCPTPKPTVPPTQVHLHIPIAGMTIVFRFKGPGTLDRLIRALQDHRQDVWGGKRVAKVTEHDMLVTIATMALKMSDLTGHDIIESLRGLGYQNVVAEARKTTKK